MGLLLLLHILWFGGWIYHPMPLMHINKVINIFLCWTIIYNQKVESANDKVRTNCHSLESVLRIIDDGFGRYYEQKGLLYICWLCFSLLMFMQEGWYITVAMRNHRPVIAMTLTWKCIFALNLHRYIYKNIRTYVHPSMKDALLVLLSLQTPNVCFVAQMEWRGTRF